MTRHQLTAIEETLTEGELPSTVGRCSCGTELSAPTEAQLWDLHRDHAAVLTGGACQCPVPLAMSRGNLCGYCAQPLRGTVASAVEMPQVVEPTHDPTRTPGVEQLPAAMTTMTPEEFHQWLDMPGTMFIVYLPERKSFVIKVPDVHHTFFVDMLKQLRLVLGPEVQAQSATPLPPTPPGEEPRPPERYNLRDDSDACDECGSV